MSLVGPLGDHDGMTAWRKRAVGGANFAHITVAAQFHVSSNDIVDEKGCFSPLFVSGIKRIYGVFAAVLAWDPTARSAV